MAAMSRRIETKYQNDEDNHAIDFIQENKLALEEDNKPVITSKGEQFLREVRDPSRRSGSSGSSAL